MRLKNLLSGRAHTTSCGLTIFFVRLLSAFALCSSSTLLFVCLRHRIASQVCFRITHQPTVRRGERCYSRGSCTCDQLSPTSGESVEGSHQSRQQSIVCVVAKTNVVPGAFSRFTGEMFLCPVRTKPLLFALTPGAALPGRRPGAV